MFRQPQSTEVVGGRQRSLRTLLLLTVTSLTACLFAVQAAATPLTKTYSSGDLNMPIESATVIYAPPIILISLDSRRLSSPFLMRGS